MKYIIELEDEPRKELFADAGNYYRCKQRPFWFISEDTRDSLTPYTEPDRKAIEDEVWDLVEDEVWELARLIVLKADDGGLKNSEFNSCFGGDSIQEVMKNYSYQEAKAKYEAWKKLKNEIRVGDEVIPIDTNYDTMIVTRIWTDDHWRDCIDTMGLDGCICSFLTSNVKKTGRHFDEVEELLKKMKE